MNQTEATALVADALDAGLSNWTPEAYDVAILTPTDLLPLHPSVILARVGDAHLSVTVEILAQP